MFKGPKPPGQARTIRTQAETNDAANFYPDPPAQDMGGVYKDDVAVPPAPRRASGEKTPFKITGS
jgi:hypothetical protein